MQLEATKGPIKYRLKTGQEVILRPGVPTELPDPAAKQLLRKAPTQVRLVDGTSRIQCGDRITWLGAHGTIRGPAEVDFIHNDADGSRWAFCTLPEGWYAVNLRFATMAKEDRG